MGDVLDGGGYDGYEGGWSQSRVASGSRLQSARQSRRGSGGKESGGLVMVGPDFVNVEEEEEGVEEDVDEGEMRRLVMGRFGGTIDWAVGWMDFRGEGEDEEEDAGVDQENRMKGELDPVELQKRLCKKKRRDDEATCGNNAKGLVRPPPEGNQASVWNDAKWLLGLATKIAL